MEYDSTTTGANREKGQSADTPRWLPARVHAFGVATALFAVACATAPPAAPAPIPIAAPAPRPIVVAPPRVNAVATLETASLASVGMDSTLTARIDSIVAVALTERAAPGASVAVGRFGRLVHLRGYGTLDYAAGSPAVTATTLYDLASLTKVVATTTLAMILEEEHKLDLDRPVHLYLPEFNAADKAAITPRMLLTHSGGLEAGAPLYLKHRGRAEFLEQINARPVRATPGTTTVYSDWDMVVLQAVIERIAGVPLDRFAYERLFLPLGMDDTRFVPDTADATLRQRIAPTAIDTSRGGLLQGTVHDGNAWAIGGVAGHAGLFASARELATFAQMLLNGGSYNGTHILSPTTIARWTARQSATSTRSLGWDTPAPGSSAGMYFSPRSFGHTGFTGTSIWIDPERSVFVVLLMNRVNSHGTSTRHAQLRRDLADAVQQAIVDAPLIQWEPPK
jgi:CubicO group peptidase (beta-lactamase class C family)